MDDKKKAHTKKLNNRVYINTSNKNVMYKIRSDLRRLKQIIFGEVGVHKNRNDTLYIISTFLCSSFNQLFTYINYSKNRAVINILAFDIKKDAEK